VTRALTSIPASGSTISTCIFRLQRRSFVLDCLTTNVRRRISTCSHTGMDFPAGVRHPKAEDPIVNIGRNSTVHPLGAPASTQRSTPVLRFEDCEMVVEEGQAWVVVGTSGAGKDILLQASKSSHYDRYVTLTSDLLFLLSVWTLVVTRSYQDPPVPSSTWWPLPILDPPAYSARSIQIRLPRLFLTPTQVPNRFLGLLGAVRCSLGRRQADVT